MKINWLIKDIAIKLFKMLRVKALISHWMIGLEKDSQINILIKIKWNCSTKLKTKLRGSKIICMHVKDNKIIAW